MKAIGKATKAVREAYMKEQQGYSSIAPADKQINE